MAWKIGHLHMPTRKGTKGQQSCHNNHQARAENIGLESDSEFRREIRVTAE